MPTMQARRHPAAPLHRSLRLVLWLAAALFVVQIPLHASTPAHLSMAEWMNRLVTGQISVTGQVETGQMNMPGMDAAVSGHDHAPAAPGGSGHAHHAEGLCCMPPVALLPTFWTPPPLPLRRQALTPPKAVREALLILRATARGPPAARMSVLQAA